MSAITTVDQVSEEKGIVVLSLNQFSPWEDRDVMIAFQNKLNGYISSVTDGGLYEQFPDLKGKPVCIRLLCNHTPEQAAKAKLDRLNGTLAEISIGLEVVLIMSSGKGRLMKNAIEQELGPVLRSIGFEGKFPILRRVRDENLDVIELQFRMSGGGFRLNLGVCSAGGVTTAWGKPIPREKISTACPMARRYLLDPRNLSLGKIDEHWFEFDDSNQIDVAKSLLQHIGLVDNWFKTGVAPEVKQVPRRKPGALHKLVTRILGL